MAGSLFPGQRRQLRLICHPELRNGLGSSGFKAELDNSQDNKNNSCLVIRCCPSIEVGDSDEKLSVVIPLFLSQAFYGISSR